MTLASARLKASVRFPPLRGMYQTRGTCKGCDNHGDLGGLGAIIEVMHGSSETPLTAVRLCGMDVIRRKALDMYGSPHLTILYLLRGEQGDLEDKSRAWIGDTRG